MQFNLREQQGLFSGHLPISLPHSAFVASPDTTALPIRTAANKDSRNLTMFGTVFELLHRSVDTGERERFAGPFAAVLQKGISRVKLFLAQ